MSPEEEEADRRASCPGLTPPDGPTAAFGVFSLHLLTLLALVTLSRSLRGKIDLAHPVFAVLHQELMVLSAGQGAVCVLLAAAVASRTEYLLLAMGFVSTLSLQFHQMSWLGITVLRYVRGVCPIGRKHTVPVESLIIQSEPEISSEKYCCKLAIYHILRHI